MSLDACESFGFAAIGMCHFAPLSMTDHTTLICIVCKRSSGSLCMISKWPIGVKKASKGGRRNRAGRKKLIDHFTAHKGRGARIGRSVEKRGGIVYFDQASAEHQANAVGESFRLKNIVGDEN